MTEVMSTGAGTATGSGGEVPVLARVRSASAPQELVVRAWPHQDRSRPVVLVVPAMGVEARYYTAFLRELHGRGLTPVIADLRGHGDNPPRASRAVRFGYRDLVEDDLHAVVSAVAAEFPHAPRYLLGHSLGGHLALLYAARRPEQVDGVALVAAGSVWFRSFPRLLGLKNLVGTQTVAIVSRVLGYWPGERLGFGGRQPALLMREWAYQARTGRYVLRDSDADFEQALRELAVPVLAVSVAGDELAPRTAVDHLSGKARRAVRTLRYYGRAEAGSDDLGHYRWVRNGSVLSRWLADWIGTTTRPD